MSLVPPQSRPETASFESHALASLMQNRSAPALMGIVNVTPDSFSDGGEFYNVNKAIDHGLQLLDEGAHILDIGGESTRPGAEVIDIKEEMARIVPVIKGLKSHASWISVDTRNAETMKAALDAGANIINDISGLTYDVESINIISEAQVPVFLMHSQGVPKTMQDNPNYNNVIADVFGFLEQQILKCKTHRIDENLIVIDPGIGFGKTLDHNLLLLRNIKDFHDLNVPVLLGASRKSFIAMLQDRMGHDDPSHDRLAGSLSSAIWGMTQGVKFVRVHDVKETRQAFDIYGAIAQCE